MEGMQVTYKSFPLFGLNPEKMSQEARGLIRYSGTIAMGGVTRKPADRTLNITHNSFDVSFALAAGGVVAAMCFLVTDRCVTPNDTNTLLYRCVYNLKTLKM